MRSEGVESPEAAAAMSCWDCGWIPVLDDVCSSSLTAEGMSMLGADDSSYSSYIWTSTPGMCSQDVDMAPLPTMHMCTRTTPSQGINITCTSLTALYAHTGEQTDYRACMCKCHRCHAVSCVCVNVTRVAASLQVP